MKNTITFPSPSLFSGVYRKAPRRTSMLKRMVRALLGYRFTPTQQPIITSHSQSAVTRCYFSQPGASCFQRNFSLLNR